MIKKSLLILTPLIQPKRMILGIININVIFKSTGLMQKDVVIIENN